jgi:hypothetical protein
VLPTPDQNFPPDIPENSAAGDNRIIWLILLAKLYYLYPVDRNQFFCRYLGFLNVKNSLKKLGLFLLLLLQI